MPLISTVEKKCSCSNLRTTGILIGGFGTFLIGIAALVALCKTDELLSQILRIREQAKGITNGVKQIEIANQYLQETMIDIGKTIKSIAAKIGVQATDLKDENLTFEQITKALKIFPESPTCGVSIYLPENIRNEIIDKLQKS